MLATVTLQPHQTYCAPQASRMNTAARHLLQVVHDELRSSDICPTAYELVLSETFGDDDLPDELRRRPDAVWIDQVSTFPPGQGVGRRVLSILLAAADEEGVALALVPTPFRVVGGLEYGALVDWYERLGFVTAFNNSVWLREPAL